ncbi:DNA-3-methyladenine glycosylase I [Pseudokineococcus basanitobsidens]|uniref:DNA-3-methyladenine glycosylase I n=1 Tax=Pseudokineococcus basanitobsidens TaxID=1926649 RepID=A0ABU8RIU7_9ACTN
MTPDAPSAVPPASSVGVGPVVGDDGRGRCPWGDAPADYRRYHDEEWGRPVTGEAALFERLSLEAFQSGLSWLTVLRKRPAFRSAFAGFDPEAVAAFGPDDRARLLADAGIVRNRAKVDAVVANARAVVALREGGGLEALLRTAAPRSGEHPVPRTTADVPSSTPASSALARDLKRAGLVFVGPTTAYATMQAVGLVDDHLAGCWVRGAAAG